MGTFKPYLSIIVTSRNDAHRLDLISRLRTTIDQWSKLCNEYRLATEYLMIEWNPPPEKPPLKSILQGIPLNEFFKIRIITVSETIHRKIDPQNTIPLHQMIAKNVGIRRAYGEFLLCTNLDIFPDSLLIQEIAKKTLQPGIFYRANRCDVPDNIYTIANHELENYSRNHIIRRMGMDARWPGLKVYKKQYCIYRYSLFRPSYPLLLILKRIILGEKKFNIARIDKEACGDFTLMSKHDWLKVQGYHEFPGYPLHIDSLALIKASLIGIKQHIFNKQCCVYHIDHTGSWTEETAHTLQIKKPYMTWKEIEKIILRMKEGFFIYNDPEWGLLNEKLSEVWVS
ncbi:MAG: hypothetical protein N2167_09475 [Flavobacteriales bacterium]|nr:hypothetical protein [Flavobacteriales bacterium]